MTKLSKTQIDNVTVNLENAEAEMVVYQPENKRFVMKIPVVEGLPPQRVAINQKEFGLTFTNSRLQPSINLINHVRSLAWFLLIS